MPTPAATPNQHHFFNNILIAVITLILQACSAAPVTSSNEAAPSKKLQRAANSQLDKLALAPGITLFAAGDIADCRFSSATENGAAATAAIINAGLAADPNAVVLSLGDNTYPIGLPSEFTDCYGPSWGAFKSRTHPAPGNHEYYSPAALGYYQYFGAAAGPEQRGYYSFNLGSWHLLSLNSNLRDDAQATQLAWIKTDLAAHPAHCTLAYWHHPLFSSGGHGNNPRSQQMWDVLQQAGADVVLVAHDHDYERFALQDGAGELDNLHGMREFVVGTGGAKLTPLLFAKLHSEARDNATHGVLKLVLKDGAYEWEFLAAAGGRFSDRGVTACH